MIRIIAIILLLATPLNGQELRTFKSTDGNEIVARVVNYNPTDGKVTIRREDNRTFTVPFNRFSAEDQAYLANWRNEYDRSFIKLNFMGIQVRSSRIIFVIDRSGSMTGDRWDKLIRNLEPIIQGIDTQSEFNIVAFDHEVARCWDAMNPATKGNKLIAFNWLQNHAPEGGSTAAGAALKNAFQDKTVEAIILLSDGYPNETPESIYNMVTQLQAEREKPVAIYTVSYQSDQGKEFLKDLAKQNDGQFATR